MVDLPVVLLQLLLSQAYVVVAGLVAAAVLLRLERQGRRETVLVLVLGVLVLDCALNPVYGSTSGVLEPTVLGRSFGLAPLLALLALGCRLLVSGVSGRVRVSTGLWALFFVWLLVAGVRGLAVGVGTSVVLYQALVLVHVGALALLAATTPPARLASRSGLPLLAMMAAPLATVITVLSLLSLSRTVAVPGLGTVVVGVVGADAATVFSSLGALCGAFALARPVGRRAGLIPAGILLATPLVAQQRAALLGLAVLIVAIAVGLAVQGTPRSIRLLSGEVALALLGLAVLVAIASGGAALSGVDTGVQARIDRTFGSTAKQQSSQSRLNQWEKAREVVERAPVQGSGLGTQYVYFEVGPDEFRRSDLTHNILFDLALRTGLIGVALFLAAVTATGLDALGALRSRAGPATRALALGAGAVVLSLFAKGMVESLFEKHRLAVLLGVAVGLVFSAARAASDETSAVAPEVLDHRRSSTVG